MSADDLFLFREGTHYALHDKLGAHAATVDGRSGVVFAVWAPNAERVSVVGSFNGWDPERHSLTPVDDSGVWTTFCDAAGVGDLYKFHIRSRRDGYRVDKSDPFAFRRQIPPESASIVCDLSYDWQDADWIERRRTREPLREPLAIYELHLGSWRRPEDDPRRLLTYDEIGDRLIPYLQETGFTHVELLPVMEHPFYGSWGYQTTGYFAAGSRQGTPQQLMRLIDRLHGRGIGVILDWVPSHFPGDEHGLVYFDGTRLFEYEDPRLGYHQDWKSYIFDYGRNEVRSFLISSALFWIERYHVDALRVDAVASMLYRDYSRAEGHWLPNKYGGNENLEAIAFLRQLNQAIHERNPGVQTIAEESTSWPMVSRAVHVGGLGFDMKWDMGWMHDTLKYMTLDPIFRKYHHEALTFRMMYAHSENFLLALSHDEVVHGKRSLLEKMSGDTWQKFANLRTLLGYMYTLPGKKLLFMGGEFGQRREWDHESSLDWPAVEHPLHAGLLRWVTDLNRLYRQRPELYDADFHPSGFAWIDCSDAEQSVICWQRRRRGDEDQDAATGLVVVANFTPVPRHNYRVGVPAGGQWRELINSDAAVYGGSGMGNLGRTEAVAMGYHGRPQSICLTLPPLSVIVLQHEPDVLVAPGASVADAGE